MASSVAAMPHESSTWRDPSRPGAAAAAGRFFGILIPEEVAEATPRRRQILARWGWAAAAAAAPSGERRAHDAELSALSSTTQPVAARAAVFRPREPSPAPSDASSTATVSAAELPPSVRASSLIQRWREIEAVGPNTPRAELSDGDDGSPRRRAVKKPSGASSVADEETEPLRKELSPPPPAAAAAAAEGLEAAGIRGARPPQLLVRTVRGRGALEELVARLAHRRRRELAALAERRAVSRFPHKGRIQSMLRLRLLRRGVTVKDEVWTLLRPVQPVQPQGGAKAAIRNGTKATDLPDPTSCSQGNNGECRKLDEQHNDGRLAVEESSNGGFVEFPVNSGSSGFQQYDEKVNTNQSQFKEDSAISVFAHGQYREDSEASGFARYDEQTNVDDHPYQEDVSPSNTASTLQEQQSSSSRGDNLRENHSVNGSWEERALWMSNFDWRTPADSMSPDSWHRDVIGDLENNSQVGFKDRPWISDSPNSWRSLFATNQADCHAMSKNTEIGQLLESKQVTKYLESDFSTKMNHVLLSLLHKQRQQHMIDFGGYYQERLCWTQNDESQTAHQESASSTLVPVSHQTFDHPESWQHPSFSQQHHASQNFLRMEVVVRSEMAQIHHEIYELRKLVESCIESQVKMQHSIKQEVCSAVRQAVQTGLMSSQPTARRGNCCICHEMQVDSLLYRCGHMCTCFNCASEMKSSSGSCPICRSPIEDVVRAHPSF